MKKWPALFISLLLGLITFALFWPVIDHQFVDYDDHLYVTDNPWVQEGLTLEGTSWAFQTSHASNWHPLTWLSHMLDCSLFDLFPGGHHLTSLLFHVANTILLFLLLKRMTGALWRSALVAALFGWHPLHVESVAWVSERKDVLSTLFWILSIWTYVRYAERPGLTRYLVALGIFALGLMAKPMVVTLPFVLLLLDYWPLGRFSRPPGENAPKPLAPSSLEPAGDEVTSLRFLGFDQRLVASSPTVQGQETNNGLRGTSPRQRWVGLFKEKLPFFALSASLCVVTVWAQHKGGAIKTLDAAPLSFRLANSLTAYGGYLWKMIWPANLAVFYPMPSHALLAKAICASLALAGISVFALCFRRRQPVFLVGWLWYLGTLVPVIGLVQVGSQAMADRYTYIPLIGIFIFVVWGLAEWCSAWPLARPLKITFAGLSLAGFAFMTGHQLQYWQDGATLFERAVQVTRTHHVTHAAFGIALSAQGRTAEAIEQFSESLRLNPNYTLAHASLASELAEQGKLAEATAHLTEVVRLRPDEAGAHNNLGVLLAKQGQIQGAMESFNTALRIKPDYLNARLNLALAFTKQKRTSEAIACYRAAVELQPPSAEPLDKLAWIMATHEDAQFRNGPGAVRLATQAIQISRHSRPGYLDTLAAAYAEAGLFKEAIATEQAALQLASQTGQKEMTSQIQNRLHFYQEGKPYHETE